jgi:putative mRNA 3-end processing factor
MIRLGGSGPPLHIAPVTRLGSWIEPFPEGIYVRPADAWIDPSQPKPKALVTHGHADHARGGHGAVWATAETLAIMDCRYGSQPGNPVQYGEVVRLGEVELSFVPAGHVLGSAQIVMDFAGQRVIMELRRRGHHEPIYIHGALQRLCDLYREHGVALGDLRPATGVKKDELRGRIILCPPGALNDRWSRRLPEPITAMASGWMRVRQRARQRNVELPLIISDHADWDELTATIQEVAPSEVWVTHGREEALIHWCAMRQIKARELNLAGYEDEDD